MNSKHCELPYTSELQLLSLKLRAEVMTLHAEVERSLRLRTSVQTVNGYRDLIEHFYRFYRPLEALLASFSEWSLSGISLSYRLQSGHLASDLEALGSSPLQILDMPSRYMPVLPSFAHALGAFYVLQGSTLGSQYILRDLTQRIGTEMWGADSFFRGHGTQVPVLWTEFKASLDGFGVKHPEHTADVMAGANATFVSVKEWMEQ